MSSILTGAFELSGLSSLQFKDVTTNDWAYSSIQALVKNEIVLVLRMGRFNQNAFNKSRICRDDGEGIR